MKQKMVFLVTLLCMVTITLTAQDQPKPKAPGIDQRVEKMAADLGLSDTQKADLKALFVKQAAEMKTLRTAEPDKESDAFKAKMKELRKSQEGELKALLGDEKYAALLKIRAEQRKKQQE